MTSARLLLASALAFALASCANKKNDYDTHGPAAVPGAAIAGTNPNQPVPAANPTYDTPAAYEEGTAAAGSATPPEALDPRNPVPPVAAEPPTQAATVHTVVKGDTLGGIATQYKVPMASIKKANGMTKDTVILGKKLQIPAH